MEILSEAGRTRLLELARAAIAEALDPVGALARVLAAPVPTELEVHRGVFVSLKKLEPADGPSLRGCIGHLVTDRPLYRVVLETAPKAALEDPRFPPMTAAELEGVRIELSVLGPSTPLRDPGGIVLGRHGVELRRSGARAVFLPQVALEQRWSVDELLRQLARKAGLADDGWRGAELSVFEAEVFCENRPGPT